MRHVASHLPSKSLPPFLSYRPHREQHGPGSVGEVNGIFLGEGQSMRSSVASAFRLVEDFHLVSVTA